MISNQLSASEKVILDRETLNYVRVVKQLSEPSNPSPRMSEARTYSIDGVKYYKPPLERDVGCIHCIQHYADLFLHNVGMEATHLLHFLPYNEIEIFSTSFINLILLVKPVLEDNPTRNLDACNERCGWKALSQYEKIKQMESIGQLKIKSSTERLFDKTLTEIKTRMRETPALLEARQEDAEELISDFISYIYQETYSILEILPHVEARALSKGIKQFAKTVKQIQNADVDINNQCGLRCCNWFKKKEPISGEEAVKLVHWSPLNPLAKSETSQNKMLEDAIKPEQEYTPVEVNIIKPEQEYTPVEVIKITDLSQIKMLGEVNKPKQPLKTVEVDTNPNPTTRKDLDGIENIV
jgi:hypothetical protein